MNFSRNIGIKAALMAVVIVAFALAFSSCNTASKAAAGNQIAYTVAHNYFVRNDVTTYGTQVINSQADFEKTFGMAPVMGDGGLPTEIDFSRQTVLSVTTPPSTHSTEIIPAALTADENGNATLKYKTLVSSEEQSYSSIASLIVVTNKLNGSTIKFSLTR